MTTVASLFGSQAEATEALDALAETEFADVETRVFEQMGPNPTEPDVAAVPYLSSGRLAGAMDPSLTEWFDDLDDKEAEFLTQRVRSGGVLVMAKVEDDQAGALEAFLSDYGGRTADEY